MGEKTGIAWTDHTFNPWWGCVKISPACTNCYAATFDARFAGENPHWGIKAPRRFFGDKHWNEPRKWDKAARAAGKPERVFCASMADVFEDRADLVEPRERLFKLIAETPMLYWLLLTKRPENIARMRPAVSTPNVWLGTTVENQDYADERISMLLANPASVHFLSCEPLLGPIDLEPWADRDCPETGSPLDEIDWVITGCESGHGARAVDIAWYRELRDWCARHGKAFFFKQAEPDARAFDPVTGIVQVGAGKGSWLKGDIIEQPYLDGVQHIAFPKGHLDP